MELKRKIGILKEKKAQVMAYADIKGKEKDSQIAKLREHLGKARDDLESLKLRISELAGDKLQGGNPDIGDLSDQNRTTQLGTHFSEIYDNEWSDAFEALPKEINEEKKARILNEIVQEILMVNEIGKKLRNCQAACTADGGACTYFSRHRALPPMMLVHSTLGGVTGFGLSSKDINNNIKRYAGRCAELSWLMVICDPPMCLSEGKEDQPFDTILYRPFTYRLEKYLSESVIKFHVWPALKLHLDGPVVAKGVAQAGEKGQKKIGLTIHLSKNSSSLQHLKK